MASVMDSTARKPYFDVYTERASPDLGLELSRSLSSLNIVPKASRKSSSKRAHPNDATPSGKQIKVNVADLSGRVQDAATFATISRATDSNRAKRTKAVEPTDDTVEDRAPREGSPPLLRPPRKSSLRSSKSGSREATTATGQNVTLGVESLPHRAPALSPPFVAAPLSRGGSDSDQPAGNHGITRQQAAGLEPSRDRLSGRSHSTPSYSADESSRSIDLSRSSTSPALSKRGEFRTISSESMVSSARWTPAGGTMSPEDVHSTPEGFEIQSISEIIGKHKSGQILTTLNMPASPPVPAIPAKFKAEKAAIPSIDDLVRKNGVSLGIPLRTAGRASSTPVASTHARIRSRTTTAGTETSNARSSIDSIAGEVMQSLKTEAVNPKRALHHARSQPNLPVPLLPTRPRQSSGDSSFRSDSISSKPPLSPLPTMSVSGESDEMIARYLRSTRLTRLLTLRKPPNHHLTVSLADVGSPYGHPVVVYLGLGSVRYLVALYDELAATLGLRLICIDRWGLGKTGEVPDSRRGFLEWTTVVEEVLDQLEIDTFSVLAHSAGAPYALASSLRLNDRINGSIHLLAPWVSTAAESAAGSYKWLKYVPSSVIKTAQAAEWKMQAWKLGKPPSHAVQGVGFDPRAPLSSESAASSPVFATFALDQQEAEDDDEEMLTPRLPVGYGRSSPSSSIASSLNQELAIRPSTSTPSLLPVPARKPSLRTKKGSKGFFGSIFSSPRVESPGSPASESAASNMSSRTARSSSASPEPRGQTKQAKIDLGTALLRASHAESLRGGTADLLTILERTGKAVGFAYSDVERPVKVWHGLKDEKISLDGVLSLERTMQNCKVNVIPGADHSLMTNVPVIAQVLKSIADEWQHS